jgi:hypothetical protein
MIRKAHTPTPAELSADANITSSDISDATHVADRDVPEMRPAFHAEIAPREVHRGAPLADLVPPDPR